MFTVDSYNDVAKQMEYDDIPVYSASKIDVDEPTPSGKYPLYDTYDFRPRVDDVTGATSGATGRIIDTSSPMSYVSTNSLTFTTEKITGESSEATATITATTDGDIVITGKY